MTDLTISEELVLTAARALMRRHPERGRSMCEMDARTVLHAVSAEIVISTLVNEAARWDAASLRGPDGTAESWVRDSILARAVQLREGT